MPCMDPRDNQDYESGYSSGYNDGLAFARRENQRNLFAEPNTEELAVDTPTAVGAPAIRSLRRRVAPIG